MISCEWNGFKRRMIIEDAGLWSYTIFVSFYYESHVVVAHKDRTIALPSFMDVMS